MLSIRSHLDFRRNFLVEKVRPTRKVSLCESLRKTMAQNDNKNVTNRKLRVEFSMEEPREKSCMKPGEKPHAACELRVDHPCDISSA